MKDQTNRSLVLTLILICSNQTNAQTCRSSGRPSRIVYGPNRMKGWIVQNFNHSVIQFRSIINPDSIWRRSFEKFLSSSRWRTLAPLPHGTCFRNNEKKWQDVRFLVVERLRAVWYWTSNGLVPFLASFCISKRAATSPLQRHSRSAYEDVGASSCEVDLKFVIALAKKANQREEICAN
jgi:hypothetical protein